MKFVDTDGEMKLWVYQQAGQSKNNKEHIDVYALPSNYHSTKTKSRDRVYGTIGYRGGI